MAPDDFPGLLRARALGAATADERAALAAAAAAEPARGRELAELDAVLAALASERELAAGSGGPVTAAEEADPTFARLQAAAATAGAELRARLCHPADRATAAATGAVASRPQRGRWQRPAAVALVAAALLVALWILRGDGAAPSLDPRPPEDLRAGGRLQLILLQPTLTADARTIAWAAVAGADGYDAAILDAAGALVLRRAEDQRKSTAWEPTAGQYSALRDRAPLRLRVTALDGSGIPIGSSGDLPLALR